MLRPRVYRCPRCNRWEVFIPIPILAAFPAGGLTVEGFDSWRAALDYALGKRDQ